MPDDIRDARLAMIRDEYGIPAERVNQPDQLRYVSVVSEYGDGDKWITTFDALDAAFADIGDDVLNGMVPVALFDLDTGESIALHVATPIVTRSADPAGAEPAPWEHDPEVCAGTGNHDGQPVDTCDECFNADGPLAFGRCDTCGAACDANGCTAYPLHIVGVS
jgi:hypothetical protein